MVEEEPSPGRLDLLFGFWWQQADQIKWDGRGCRFCYSVSSGFVLASSIRNARTTLAAANQPVWGGLFFFFFLDLYYRYAPAGESSIQGGRRSTLAR